MTEAYTHYYWKGNVVERLLPTPEVWGLNPVVANFYLKHLFTVICIDRTKIKKKRLGIDYFENIKWTKNEPSKVCLFRKQKCVRQQLRQIPHRRGQRLRQVDRQTEAGASRNGCQRRRGLTRSRMKRARINLKSALGKSSSRWLMNSSTVKVANPGGLIPF